MKSQGETADLVVDAFMNRFIPVAHAKIEAIVTQEFHLLGQYDPSFAQCLDSLATMASHAPLPLLKALIRWRQQEWSICLSTIKDGALAAVQMKLGIEVVFTCACVRFAENCPSSSLPEDLWLGLEDYIFDWLSHVEKCVPVNEMPTLNDHRTLLLDHIAQLVRALSIQRFRPLTDRFFNELNSRAVDNPTARSENTSFARHIPVLDLFLVRTVAEYKRFDANLPRQELLNIIHGMRHVKLPTKTVSELLSSKNFLIFANPLSRAPSKKKTELQHALCSMLTSVLLPMADSASWPPPFSGEAVTAWNAAVLQMRAQLISWMEKQSSLPLQLEKQTRHIQVAYPLITALLCLGEKHSFKDGFSALLDMFFRQLKEKQYKGVVLDCLNHATSFYLNVHARTCTKKEVEDTLQRVTLPLMSILKKGAISQDSQFDRVVDLCVTIAKTNFDFVMEEIVLELLRGSSSLGETKVIGLRALLGVVNFAVERDSFRQGAPKGAMYEASQLRPFESSLLLLHSSPTLHPLDSLRQGISQIPLLFPYIDKIRGYLGGIIKVCHSTFGSLNMITAKGAPESYSKDRQQGLQVFRWALKCAPHLVPEQWRVEKMADTVPQYSISTDFGVREEAVQVLFRTMKDLPSMRSQILRGLADFVLQIPDEFPILIQSTLARLVQLLTTWRITIDQEASQKQGAGKYGARRHWVSSTESMPMAGGEGDASRALQQGSVPMNAIGLIFFCSGDIQIRRTALELLKNVRGLALDLQGLEPLDPSLEPLPAHVIDVFEEMGENIVQRCYWNASSWCDAPPLEKMEPVPSEVTLQTVLEGQDNIRWAACYSELVKHCSSLCHDSVLSARAGVVSRMNSIDISELYFSTKSSFTGPDVRLRIEQWLLYAVFACSCPPEDGPQGGFLNSVKQLLLLILPLGRFGIDTINDAVSMALGSCHSDVCEAMLTELASWIEEVQYPEGRKSKGLKLRREDMKILESTVYRLLAQNLWPGIIKQRPWLRQHYLKFISDTYDYLMQCNGDLFGDAQKVRFNLASVVHYLGKELVDVASDRFDIKSRRKLFELFGSWSDEFSIGMVSEGSPAYIYKRELEKYRQSYLLRSKDPNERVDIEREISLQNEAIEWISVQAMSTLCYGPCFDDSFHKQSGRLTWWISALMDEKAPYGPATTSVAPISHARIGYGSQKGRWGMRKGSTTLAWRRNGLAKEALLNLLQTNLDLLPACIDQCYNEDPCLGNGYFAVLAEIYMRYDCFKCPVQRLISLILYKVIDPLRETRDDALQMLECLSIRRWSRKTDVNGSNYTAAVVGSLPDSYHQFQYQLSCTLAKEHPELSELLCEEIMQRQLDAVDIIAQHQVLTCMTPWMESLDLLALSNSGWSERLLKSLYYVTWKHGQHFPDEIERLWLTLAQKPTNIVPILEFLLVMGVSECESNTSGEIGEALITFFSVAKRTSLYLARVSPQQTIDHLVLELSNRILEEDSDVDIKRSMDAFARDLDNVQAMEFSQGIIPIQEPSTPSQVTFPALSGDSLTPDEQKVAHKRNYSSTVPLSWTFRSHLKSKSGDISSNQKSSSFGFKETLTTMAGESLEPAAGEAAYVHSAHVGSNARSASTSSIGNWLSRADIALVLLTEIAYENDEDFRGHLPMLFQACFLGMDSSEPVLLEHSQQLLVNLLYTLAGRHLEIYEGRELDDGEYKKQVVSLIQYVQSKKGSLLWDIEDTSAVGSPLKSTSLVSSLVLSVVDAIFFQNDLRERWGLEALKWALYSGSRHVAGRSHQILRALCPPLSPAHCMSLVYCLHQCFCNLSLPILGMVQEVLLTLQVMVDSMDRQKVVLYPQLFWSCAALLHTDYVHVYSSTLVLLSKVMDRIDFYDPVHEQVLLSTMPHRQEDSSRGPSSPPLEEEDDSAPAFEGLQPLILKGLMSSVSHDLAVNILSRLILLPSNGVVGSSETRLLMQCVALLPWFSIQLEDDASWQGVDMAKKVAHDIGQACLRQNLNELANEFFLYSNGHLQSCSHFISKMVSLLCQTWFPVLANLAVSHLMKLLEKGPPMYQKPVLLMLMAFLENQAVESDQIPLMYATVSHFLESSHCEQEAKQVVELMLLGSTPLTRSDTSKSSASVSRVAADGSRAMAPGQGGDGRGKGPLRGLIVDTSALLPSREVAVKNTRFALAEVLATYEKDLKFEKLVPFVDSFPSSPFTPGAVGMERSPRALTPLISRTGSRRPIGPMDE